MDKAEMKTVLLDAKKRAGKTWIELGEATGTSEIWLASAFYGESSTTPEVAEKITAALAVAEPVGAQVRDALVAFPTKGNSLGDRVVPTDPLLYRFYEILAVYGHTLKDVIQEKFGDGIMSAIDFTMDVRKVEDPKGDRVLLTMNGKFLPYKKW